MQTNKKYNSGQATAKAGQAALILIILSAAALIFYAATLNWGRIAQTKSVLTIAADESTALLASEAASTGELYKREFMNNANRYTVIDWKIVLAIIIVVIMIIITILCWGTCASGTIAIIVAEVIAVIGIILALASLILQLAVIEPGIEQMWNSMMRNQPEYQQFYESGVQTALFAAATDSVNVPDYLDWNANGVMGNNPDGTPKDTVSRLAVYYTERLKMINTQGNGGVSYFYNQLGEFINGETCSQNAAEHNSNSSMMLDPDCYALNCIVNPSDPACQSKIPSMETCAQNANQIKISLTMPNSPSVPLNPLCPGDCISNPSDPACQTQVANPFGFQLSDSCPASSDSTAGSYNPYCDPCCQPTSTRPSSCDPATIPQECYVNNPYNSAPTATDSPYPLLYDPSYQNYADGVSFLSQYGRDQQSGPITNALTPQGNFPNGIYPFFWLTHNYSLEVDNIDPVNTPVTTQQLHWCSVATTPTNGTITILQQLNASGLSDLNQLVLTNKCQNDDCCVDHFASGVTSSSVLATSAPVTGTVGAESTPTIGSVTVTSNGSPITGLILPGASITLIVQASENVPTGAAIGSISSVVFNINGPDGVINKQTTGSAGAYSVTITIPSTATTGSYTISATATDSFNNSIVSTPPVIINIGLPMSTFPSPTPTTTTTGTLGDAPTAPPSTNLPSGYGCTSGANCASGNCNAGVCQ